MICSCSCSIDAVDHNILIHRLERVIKIQWTTLVWSISWLSDCYQFAHVSSLYVRVSHVIQQDAELESFPFYPCFPEETLLGRIFKCYADDAAIFIHEDRGAREVSEASSFSLKHTILDDLKFPS